MRVLKKSFSLIYSIKYGSVAIVMVDGGLASQVFKFAFGEWLATRLDCSVFYDLSWFKKYGRDIRNEEDRPFSIMEVFPTVGLHEPNPNMLKNLRMFCPYSNAKPHIQLKVTELRSPIYYDGYYANANYFQEQEERLRSVLVFSDKIKNSSRSNLWARKISECENPVAVHVRRGDFVDSIHDVIGVKYFANAIRHLKDIYDHGDNLGLFFFTNDETYVEQVIAPTISGKNNYVIISGSSATAGEDMYLMSLCKNFVISNSGFSWVASWLCENKAKHVCMPHKWFVIENEMTEGSETAFSYPGTSSIVF